MATLRRWPSARAGPVGLAEDVRHSLADTSRSLFAEEGPLELMVAKRGPDGLREAWLEDEHAVDEYLRQTSTPTRPEDGDEKAAHDHQARYFFVHPSFGWGPLQITERAMLAVLSRVQVFPQFYRHLAAFGRKSSCRDESFGGFDSAESLDSGGALAGFECCYLWKYVQKTDAALADSNSWSIRHALVYQKTSFRDRTSDHILIRPSDSTNRHLKQSLSENDEIAGAVVADWTRIHTLCMETVDDGFRESTNYLDEKISKLFDRIIMSSALPSNLLEFDNPEQASRDMKALLALGDVARRTASVIELNMVTVEAMAEATHRLAALESCQAGRRTAAAAAQLDNFLRRLGESKRRHQYALHNVSLLVERTCRLSGLLRNTVALRNAELSRLSTEATLEMSKQSGYEAHVVKMLTVLALLYVPASFASEFLQMGFVSIDNESFRVEATAGLKLYFALAVPLIVLTMCVYGLVETAKRRSIRGQAAAAKTSIA